MSRTMMKRRGVLRVLSLASFSAAGLVSGVGALTARAASLFKKPQTRSQYVSYILGQPLIVTIEHPDYDPTSTVASWAELKSTVNSAAFGRWAIAPDSNGKKGQVVRGKRLTVVLHTDNVYAATGPLPSGTLSAPPKSTPAPPSGPGSGTILCIVTNVATDECDPMYPILLDPVDIAS
jgi:hypothetical protein